MPITNHLIRKMSNKSKIAFILGLIGIMALLVWMFTSSDEVERPEEKKPEVFVSDNWNRKFLHTDKEPYGLYLFDVMLRAHFKGQKVSIVGDTSAFNAKIVRHKSPKTFLFVGNNFGLEDQEMDTLLRRVEQGSDFFISFGNLTQNLFPKLLKGVDFAYEYDEGVHVFADSTRYRMLSIFQNDTIASDWKAFFMEDSATYTTLSSFMEMSNFVRIPRGEGNIYLHANPEMFCNYQLKRGEGYGYTQFVLNELPDQQDVLILELGRLSDNYGNYDVDDDTGADGKKDDSYLKEIFANPTLLSAFLLSIAGLLLFIIFRSRRVRPIVPYLPPKKNMTLAFAETITSIYFAKRNPYGLLQVQRKNFYAMVQKHFFVDLSRREDDKSVQMLAEKSNRRFDEIKGLLAVLETNEAFSVNEPFVADVQKRIHAFYRSTGVVSDDMQKRVDAREIVYKRSLLLPSLMILAGLKFIVYGTYLLILSIGTGIVFWPIGILSLYLGIIRLMNPYFSISKDEFIFYMLPYGKRVYPRDRLVSVEQGKRRVTFHF
ncbi:MAG: hypothetical protein A3D92_11820, partial [Bacteroidetes bacterium RIFCSPHIGHO2_02_FULL_44_7]